MPVAALNGPSFCVLAGTAASPPALDTIPPRCTSRTASAGKAASGVEGSGVGSGRVFIGVWMTFADIAEQESCIFRRCGACETVFGKRRTRAAWSVDA